MSFYLFRRYFLSSRSSSLIKFISWLCLAGVAVSISALLLIVSVMGGLGEAVKMRLLSKQAHLRIQLDDNPFPRMIPVLGKKNLSFDSKFMPDFLVQSLEKKQGIKSVQTFELQELILKSDQGFKGVSAKGYDKNTWNHIKESAVKESFHSPQPVFLENKNSAMADTRADQKPFPLKPSHGVLISYDLALETGLSKGDDAVFIPIMGLLLPPGMPPPVKVFKVEGVLESSPLSVYYQQGTMNFGNFSKINYQSEIQLYKPEKVLEYQDLFKQYKVKNWMEENSNLFFALKLEKFIMTLFFTISLLISCLGISSALLLLMTQKGEDIAILQAMGMSQKEIVKSFTRIGLYLSSLGLLAGALIGLSIVLFLKSNSINILPAMYQDRTIPAKFLPMDYTFIFLGAGILSYLFCYLPTRYFSRMNVVSLLKRTYF